MASTELEPADRKRLMLSLSSVGVGFALVLAAAALPAPAWFLFLTLGLGVPAVLVGFVAAFIVYRVAVASAPKRSRKGLDGALNKQSDGR